MSLSKQNSSVQRETMRGPYIPCVKSACQASTSSWSTCRIALLSDLELSWALLPALTFLRHCLQGRAPCGRYLHGKLSKVRTNALRLTICTRWALPHRGCPRAREFSSIQRRESSTASAAEHASPFIPWQARSSATGGPPTRMRWQDENVPPVSLILVMTITIW